MKRDAVCSPYSTSRGRVAAGERSGCDLCCAYAYAQIVFDRGLLLGQLFLASITASDRARDRHGTLVVVLSMKTSYGKDRSEEEAEAPYAAAGLGKYVALFVLAAGAAATAYQGLGRGANGSGRSVQLQSRRSAVDDHGSDEGTETSRSATHQIPHHCRCLFIDVGLNNGDSLIQWPRAAADESRLTPAQRRGMRQCLSDVHVNSTCYVGFEANPNFNARLLDVEKALLSSGRRVRIFRETAVSTKDGTVEFMVDTQGHGLGSSVEKSKALVTLKNGQWNTDFSRSIKDVYQKVLVSSVDLGRFLHTAHQRSHFVAVKLDVEGLEYKLLRHMLQYYSHALCKCKLLAIEWHERMMLEEQGSAQQLTSTLTAEPCGVPVLQWA